MSTQTSHTNIQDMAMQPKSILLVGAQHGDEYLGDAVLETLRTQHPQLLDTCDYIVGNPKAYLQKTRYTEADLNRSYGKATTTYESSRAHAITQLIEQRRYTLVLDLHTTSIDMPPCLIGPAPTSPHVKRFIAASPYENIVTLEPELAQCSLVGTAPHAIAVEVYEATIEQEAVRIVDSIIRYLAGTSSECDHYEYAMVGKIYKKDIDEAAALLLKNYEYNATIDGVPILVGENSYKKTTNYYGFKTRKRQPLAL